MRISETTNGSKARACAEREASKIRAAIRFIVDSVRLIVATGDETGRWIFARGRH
jgi:hypothetical protein